MLATEELKKSANMGLRDTGAPGMFAPAPTPKPVAAARALANNPAPVMPPPRATLANVASAAVDGFQTGMGMIMSDAPTAPAPAVAAEPAKASGLQAPWWSPEYARAAAASDQSGLELEQSRRSAAAVGDPVKALVLNGVFGGPNSPAAAGTPAPAPAVTAPAPAPAPAETPRIPLTTSGLFEFMPGLNSVQAAQAAAAPQTGLRATTVGEGVTLGGEKVDPNQKLITNVGGDAAARAGLSATAAPAGMPAPAGVGGTAADNMRQLNNILALRESTPMGGVAIMNDPNEALNAERTARWRADAANEAARYNPHAAGAIANIHNAGVQAETAKANTAAHTAITTRGQDIGAQTAAAGQKVQERGQDLQAGAVDKQVGLGMQRIASSEKEGAADRGVRMDVANLHATTENKKLTAAEKAAAAKAHPKWVPIQTMPGMMIDENAAVPRLFDTRQLAEKK